MIPERANPDYSVIDADGWEDRLEWVGADDVLSCGLENPEVCESCQ